MENLTEDLEAMWALLDRDEPDHAEMRESFSALRNAETSVRSASQFARNAVAAHLSKQFARSNRTKSQPLADIFDVVPSI